MPAEIRYVAGPRVEQEMGPDRRYTGRERIVLAVTVGESDRQRMVPLSEADLFRLAQSALAMLDKLHQERSAG